jgi:hypothetical protein
MAKIFIGSSGRMIPVVQEIAACLKSHGHQPLPWTETFEHGDITLDRLIALARDVNGAILVSSGDDKLEGGYYQPRANVLVEFGLFAAILGRKRAIVCRSGEHQFPSDLGGVTYLDLETTSHALSARIHDKLRHWAAGLIREIDPSVGEVGITQVFSSFPLSDFKRALQEAKLVHILQTFIPYTQHLHHFEGELMEALQRGCEVQVLLLNPWSNAVELRQRSLNPGYGRDSVRQQICSNLEHFATFTTKLPRDRCERLQVRVHAAMPSMSIYRVDDMSLCGHYFHGSLAIDSPQLKITNVHSSMGRRLVNEHSQLWNSDATVAVDLYNIDRWLNGNPLPSSGHLAGGSR